MTSMLSYLWGGKKEKPENDNAELALREALDAHSDFAIKDDSVMEFDDFVVLNSIIQRQGIRHFADERDKLKVESLELFKKNPTSQEYAENFAKQAKGAMNATKFMTEKACEWIEYGLGDFNKSRSFYMDDKEKSHQMALKLRQVRETFTIQRYKFPKTKEDAIKAYTWRIAEDNKIHRKVMLQKYISPPEVVMNYNGIETQKMNDAMKLEFDFDLDQLQEAISQFNLTEDKQFTMLQQISNKQKMSDEQKFMDSCKPSEEMKAEYLKKADAFGKAQFKADQTLTFDFFLNTKCLSIEYSALRQRDTFEAMKHERREKLKELAGAENKEEYLLLLIKKVAMQHMTENLFDATIYQHLKVPEKTYQKTMANYLMQADKRKQYEEDTEKAREKNAKKEFKEMTREEVLKATKRLEQFKFDAQLKMYQIVRSRQMPPSMINTIIQFEKDRAEDQFFLELGIDEEDNVHNVKRLKMDTEDDEYKKLTKEWAQKSEDFLKEQQEMAMKHMAKMKAQQEQMAKEALQASTQIETTTNQTEDQTQLSANMLSADSLLM